MDNEGSIEFEVCKLEKRLADGENVKLVILDAMRLGVERGISMLAKNLEESTDMRMGGHVD